MTVSAWVDGAWQRVVTRRGIPRTTEPLQLGEVEAYAIQLAAYPAPTGATLPPLLEAGDYPFTA